MFCAWLHHVTSRRFELHRLEKAARTHERPELPVLVWIDSSKAVWRLSVPGHGPRFMSVSSGVINQDCFVVHLDAENFYRAWLKASPAMRSCRSADCICRADMPGDYKFRWAAEGFAQGPSNPVPLAEAGVYRESNGRFHVGFSNGITRTFWLLANRCPAFPVKIYGSDSAKLLHQVVGLDTGPMPLAELFSGC